MVFLAVHVNDSETTSLIHCKGTTEYVCYRSWDPGASLLGKEQHISVEEQQEWTWSCSAGVGRMTVNSSPNTCAVSHKPVLVPAFSAEGPRHSDTRVAVSTPVPRSWFLTAFSNKGVQGTSEKVRIPIPRAELELCGCSGRQEVATCSRQDR